MAAGWLSVWPPQRVAVPSISDRARTNGSVPLLSPPVH